VEIVTTGRRTEVSERFRQQAEEKLAKVSQFAPRAHRVDVELSHERNPRQADICMKVEITVLDKGPVVRAEACSDEAVAAFDIAFGKLLERLRRLGDRRKVHHGRQTPASLRLRPGASPGSLAPLTPPGGLSAVDGAGAGSAGRAATAILTDPPRSTGRVDSEAVPDAADDAPAIPDLAHIKDGEFADGPLVIRAKDHAAVPMTLDQALYEMELIGHDFFLFVDAPTGRPSVVYRRHGYHYGVIRLQLNGDAGDEATQH
jgi:ribosomal subunit interface protein